MVCTFGVAFFLLLKQQASHLHPTGRLEHKRNSHQEEILQIVQVLKAAQPLAKPKAAENRRGSRGRVHQSAWNTWDRTRPALPCSESSYGSSFVFDSQGSKRPHPPVPSHLDPDQATVSPTISRGRRSDFRWCKAGGPPPEYQTKPNHLPFVCVSSRKAPADSDPRAWARSGGG